MTSFQKPENALKRAEELIDIGKKQDALETLHLAIQHRKWRNNWTITIEKIMLRHLELCVELKKMRTAREGLHQYRTTCQAANIGSLETVVQTFRLHAEAKVTEAKKAQEEEGKKAEGMEDLGDLDEMESPQTILLKAIQQHDTRQQSQDKDVHAHFRFLWETYRVVLDVLKSNARLEEVYHETARHAFEFCRTNKRQQEFKRLCETLRKNYLDLGKRTGPPNQHSVNPNAPETISRTIDTRFAQLRTATELDLWREAYNTATEIFELMNRTKTKPKTRSEYYDFLGQIFWKSDNYLFHAFACLKNVLYVKAVKRDLSKEDLERMASKALMATLCVPFQKHSDLHATLELADGSQSSPYEKAKKHATLFNAQSVPTRDSIIAQLHEKHLIPHASEACQKLFALIESDFTPLSLCQDSKPFLDQIDVLNDGYLTEYITPVKKIIFFRLMKQLSEVYANMTISNFESAASIVPFNIAEKWMANAARQQGINIQINYKDRAIVFGAARKVDMKSMRQPLIEIGHKLQQAMQRVAPEEQQKKEKSKRKEIEKSIQQRVNEERSLIRQRHEEIERRKEESERRKNEEQRAEMAAQNAKAEKEAALERQRLQEERAKREVERQEQKKRDEKMKQTQDMLEAMKKLDESKPTNLKIGGKKIADIQAEDVQDISFDQLEKAREAQVQRERQEKIRQRKLESKRVDHLARAMREEEKGLLGDWADRIQEADDKAHDDFEVREEEKLKADHEKLLAEKNIFLAYQQYKEDWEDKKLEERRAEHEEKVAAQLEAAKDREAKAKVDRARKRKEEDDRQRRTADDKKRREEEDAKRKEQAEARRKQEEEEEAQRREEEESARKEEEERKAKRREELKAERAERDQENQRVLDKQRQREKEIEERRAAERSGGGDRDDRRGGRDQGRDQGRDSDDRFANLRSGGGGGGGGWRDREAAKTGDSAPSERPVPAWKRTKEARADEDDGWRRREEPAKPAGRPWGNKDRDGDKGGDGDDWSEVRRNDDEPRGGKGGASRQPREAQAPRENAWAKRAQGADEAPAPKPAPAQEEAAAAAPAPAAEEDDDGFETVTKPSKKKKAPAAEEPAGKAAPPWRRDGAEQTKDSRSDWKSRGDESKGDRPWNRK